MFADIFCTLALHERRFPRVLETVFSSVIFPGLAKGHRMGLCYFSGPVVDRLVHHGPYSIASSHCAPLDLLSLHHEVHHERGLNEHV